MDKEEQEEPLGDTKQEIDDLQMEGTDLGLINHLKIHTRSLK